MPARTDRPWRRPGARPAAHRIRRTGAVSAALVAMSICPWAEATARLPEDPGPYEVVVRQAAIEAGDDVPGVTLRSDIPVDVYFPAAPVAPSDSPHPVMVLFHGICPGDPSNLTGYAERLASHGYVALNMETRMTRCDSQHLDVDARDMLKLLSDGAIAELGREVPELAGRVDRTRMGIGGHSRGGHTALLAAESPYVDGERIDLDAVLLLDTKVRRGFNFGGPVTVGEDPARFDTLVAADRLTQPIAIISAEKEGNIVGDDGAELMAALPETTRKMGLRVDEAAHFDAISDGFDGLYDGPPRDGSRYVLFLRYASAFLDHYLKGGKARAGTAAYVDRDGARRMADADPGVDPRIEIDGVWERTTDLG